ncbi:PhzF family phenazine biosynthesis protein [Parabacteroides sp. OttesenSCG-928-N08]|nr:PhzF family phenazine biosynthesis protein [Parabacteroides sp. OttesenSCG-928-N08]
MRLISFQVDAFTDRLFSGNPAAVILTEEPLSDRLMQQIAGENGLPETAFILKQEESIQLRWFTPDLEMDLCGHATLAAAHVLFNELHLADKQVEFETRSGILRVTRGKKGAYRMEFPLREAAPASLPPEIAESLSIAPLEIYKARDYLLVYAQQSDIESIQIDRQRFDQINLGEGGVIVTAPGKKCDFVSRFFTPQATIFEDPVTGSAHCTLTPYWAKRLRRNELRAQQLSKRGGTLRCSLTDEKVFIEGTAVTYCQGELYL